MRDLMPQQEKALNYSLPRKLLALYMEMRLGKSMVAIRWAEKKKAKRVLIVSPNPVVRVWQEELFLEEWAEEDVSVIKGSRNKKLEAALSETARWFIVNYEGLLSCPEILGRGFDCIILDESTKIRNPKAKITKLLTKCAHAIPMRAVLSGFPAPESVLDYFEQLRFLYGEFMGFKNYWSFRNTLFQRFGYTYTCSAEVKSRIKEAVKDLTFIMTRQEAGYEDKKVYEKRYVPLNYSQKHMLKQIEEGFEFRIPGKKKPERTKWAPVKFQWMSQVAGGFSPDGRLLSDEKNSEIVRLLKEELRGEPLIVWYRFESELKNSLKFLRKKGIKAGSFSGEDKSDAKRFEKGEIQVLCAQGKCGSFGFDWSRSSTMVYYSNWPDGEIRSQTEDRIINVRKNPVRLYIDLVSEGSIDELMVQLLREKKRGSNEFFNELRKRWIELSS